MSKLMSTFIDLVLLYSVPVPIGALLSVILQNHYPFWFGIIAFGFGFVHCVIGLVYEIFMMIKWYLTNKQEIERLRTEREVLWKTVSELKESHRSVTLEVDCLRDYLREFGFIEGYENWKLKKV